MLSFVGLVLFFGIVANLRAKSAGDEFHTVRFIPFVGAGCAIIALLGTRVTFPICLVFASVCTCAVTDLSSGYVYDVVTYPSLVVLLLSAFFNGTLTSTAMWTCVSFGSVALLGAFTRWQGLGFGDIKLFTVIAAGFCARIIEVFGASFVIGASVIAVGLLCRRVRFGDRVPFAPYIAIATILAVPCEAFLK